MVGVRKGDMMWLLIDDIRELNCDIIARTAEAGKIALSHLHTEIECLALDHDLRGEETGYDICKWALSEGYMPDHVQLVTENVPGRENMAAYLESHGFIRKDTANFERVNG